MEVGVEFGSFRSPAPFQTKKRFFEAIHLNFSESRDGNLEKSASFWENSALCSENG
jgi:hypothetical protein